MNNTWRAHTIFLKDDMLYVVPMADIASFEGGQIVNSKAVPK
jgi:hypothetical protein